MTDIIFINDIDDYNAYKKLKPVNTYKYKKFNLYAGNVVKNH